MHRNIAIFQTDLSVGGIQKSLVTLLESDILDEYSVDVYLFGKRTFFDVGQKKNIKFVYLEPLPSYCKLLPFTVVNRFYSKKYKLEKNYDLAIDFNSYSYECSIATLNAIGARKVMWIHNDVELKLKHELKYKLLWNLSKEKCTYYDEFVAVSQGIVDGFRKSSGIFDKKVTVIPNIVNSKEVLEKANEQCDVSVDNNYFNLISVGALKYQKGFDILLNTFSEVLKKRNDIRLYIVGRGDEEKKLKKIVQDRNMENNVFFLGSRANPYSVMNIMDGFVLASRYEGQGIVIVEAYCLGLDIIIPKSLEKYNEGIEAVADLQAGILTISKHEKKYSDLHEYNQYIEKQYRTILDSN